MPLALADAGASIVPRAAADAAARRSDIHLARLSPAIRRTIGLVRRAGPVSPAAGAFIDQVRAHARPPDTPAGM
jgi:DNA-binding transcriptional LysR family regulator